MSTKYYYASYSYTPNEVAIFADEKKRDSWIACQDEMSKLFPPLDTDRIKRTAKEVHTIYGTDMYNKKRWNGDPNNPGVFWLLPKTNKEVQEEKIKKYARRAAENLYNSIHPTEPTTTAEPINEDISCSSQSDITIDMYETPEEKIRREVLEELGMKEYHMTVTKTFNRDFTIVASNEEEAKKKAYEQCNLGNIVDYDTDLSSVDIKLQKPEVDKIIEQIEQIRPVNKKGYTVETNKHKCNGADFKGYKYYINITDGKNTATFHNDGESNITLENFSECTNEYGSRFLYYKENGTLTYCRGFGVSKNFKGQKVKALEFAKSCLDIPIKFIDKGGILTYTI